METAIFENWGLGITIPGQIKERKFPKHGVRLMC